MNFSGRRFALGCLALSVSALLGCGSPTESTPLPVETGPLTGSYTLHIDPAAGCSLPGLPVEFSMVATSTGTAAKPEAWITLPGGDSTIAALLLVDDGGVSGSIGSRAPIALPSGVFLYFRTFGTGAVTRAADGRGQILDGTMFGDIRADETNVVADMAVCTADDHHFSLTVR